MLVLAAQHGDEWRARSAVASWARRHHRESINDVQVAVIGNVNPDGAIRRTRENAKGVDINRDHLLLAAAETQAVHAFVRDYQPHLIVDVHTYPSRRQHLLAHDLIYCHDLFVDVPTNPSLVHALVAPEAPDFLSWFIDGMQAAGFRGERYTLVETNGRVRHSTCDVRDARKGLTLRFGVPTILLEAREPRRGNVASARKRVTRTLEQALELVLIWARTHADHLRAERATPGPGDWFAVGSRYLEADSLFRMPFEDANTGTVRAVELPGAYTPQAVPTRGVELPHAYAVPANRKALLEVLRRHGFESTEPGSVANVEYYRVGRIRSRRRPDRPPRVRAVRVVGTPDQLRECRIFPLDQRGGYTLAVLLEPESKYGLARFPDLKLSLKRKRKYPILRVA
jgi:hypothetical protein